MKTRIQMIKSQQEKTINEAKGKTKEVKQSTDGITFFEKANIQAFVEIEVQKENKCHCVIL